MHAHGQLTAPLPSGASALKGPVAVLLSPVGEELEAAPLPPEEVLNVAADVLGAILELLVSHRPSPFPSMEASTLANPSDLFATS